MVVREEMLPPESLRRECISGFPAKKEKCADTEGQGAIFEKRVRSITDGSLQEGEGALADVILKDADTGW